MNDTLHWYCWIHDSPEACANGACEFGYWLCPEDGEGMDKQDDGTWHCGDCDTVVGPFPEHA